MQQRSCNDNENDNEDDNEDGNLQGEVKKVHIWGGNGSHYENENENERRISRKDLEQWFPSSLCEILDFSPFG